MQNLIKKISFLFDIIYGEIFEKSLNIMLQLFILFVTIIFLICSIFLAGTAKGIIFSLLLVILMFWNLFLDEKFDILKPLKNKINLLDKNRKFKKNFFMNVRIMVPAFFILLFVIFIIFI